MHITRFIFALCRDVRGATAVEYGLILAMIVLAMIFAMQEFANASIQMWNYVSTNVSNV